MHAVARMSSTIAGRLRLGAGTLLRSLARRAEAAPAQLAARQNRRVSWIAGASPEDEAAAAVREAIAVRGLHTYGPIAQHVAERLYRRDAGAGGWAADIGFSSPRYLGHAADVLDRLDGRAVRIETGEDGAR